MNSGPTGSVIVSFRMRSISSLSAAVRVQPIRGADSFHLMGMTRAPEGYIYSLIENPPHRQLHHSLAVTLPGKLIESADRSQILTEARLLEFGVDFSQVIAAELCVRFHLATEQAAAKGSVGKQRNTVFLAVGEHVLLNLPLEQVVRRLTGLDRCCLAKDIHLRGRIVADTDCAYLSRLVKLSHSRGGLFERNERIGPVDLIYVDVVGLQPAKRVLHFGCDPCSGCIAEDSPILPLQGNFCGDNNPVSAAAAGNGLADDLLRSAESVHRRGVDHRYPMVKSGMDRADRFLFLGAAPHPAPDGPSAKGNPRCPDGYTL